MLQEKQTSSYPNDWRKEKLFGSVQENIVVCVKLIVLFL